MLIVMINKAVLTDFYTKIIIMKKSHLSFIITFILFVGIGLNAFSQTKSKAKTNTQKIHINKKGEIHDHGWNKIGVIGKDDIVRDNK